MSLSTPNPLQQIASAPSEFPASEFRPLGVNIKVLMVWPRFPPSFWGFEGVLEMLPEKSVAPPLGLITVAALCPPPGRSACSTTLSKSCSTRICFGLIL